MNITSKVILLMLAGVLLISACGSNLPLVDTGSGTSATPEQAVNSAPEAVKSFFDALVPIVDTTKTGFVEIGKIVFSVLPGFMVDPVVIEKRRLEIQASDDEFMKTVK